MSRLNKRKWLIDNFDHLFQEAVFHRDHKDEFISLEREVMWDHDEDEGVVEYETT